MNQGPKTQNLAFHPDQASYAEVIVTLPFDQGFDYLCTLEGDIAPGEVVLVPFGGRKVYGIVSDVKSTTQTPKQKLKGLIHKVEGYKLSASDLKFIRWMSRYTMIPQGLVAKMFLSVPAALEEQQTTFGYQLASHFDAQIKTAKQQAVIEWFADHPGVYKKAEIGVGSGASLAVIKRLIDQKVLQPVALRETVPVLNPDYATLTYSPEQQEVVTSLVHSVSTKKYETILLDGVTGSGKTEVYFEAIAQALRQGQQSVVLLPEISLTPQWLDRFERRFGEKPVTWHSQMTPAKRRDAWRQIASGEAKVIVGARSALMLLYANLGLIIVDEEHETSYKQEEVAIYHARDMAVARAHHLGIPVVLVSATPSLESYANARDGKYTLLRLPYRHGSATLPDLELVDMRGKERRDEEGVPRFLSKELRSALTIALADGEQSLLFLNRRGYAPLTLCQSCGERMQCPRCTAWLVQHKSTERLHCHHCDYSIRQPNECPGCHEEDTFVPCGPGVERIAEEVSAFLPDARILIMASDAFETPQELVAAIEKIQRAEVDIIIGTQIMAKGHHFPQLTLVGIIDADLGLSGGDLRACEKTYQLLQQVAGRCGRAERKGHVLLQTHYPDHPVMKALVSDNKNDFFDRESEARQETMMPPYSTLAALIVSSKDARLVENWVKSLRRHAKEIPEVEIFGPSPAPMAILRGSHRWRFLLRAPKNYPIQSYIQHWLSSQDLPRALKVQIDIDPISFV